MKRFVSLVLAIAIAMTMSVGAFTSFASVTGSYSEYEGDNGMYNVTKYSTSYDGSEYQLYFSDAEAYVTQVLELKEYADSIQIGAGGSGNIAISLYNYDTDLATSVAGTAITEQTVLLSHSSWRTGITLDSTIAPGKYVINIAPVDTGYTGYWISAAAYAEGMAPTADEVDWDAITFNGATPDFTGKGISYRTWLDKNFVAPTDVPTEEPTEEPTAAPGSDAQNAISVPSVPTTVTIPGGAKVYYTYSAFVSQTLTVANASDFAVYAVARRSETAIPVVNEVASGVVEPVGMSVVFAIENLTASEQFYSINLEEYNPIGTMTNPDTLTLGENVATPNEGYYYTFEATEAGSLKITMSDEATDWGWYYQLTNETQYIYGSSHMSSETPVVLSDSVACAAGDIITVLIDTENMSSNPVAFTAEFIPESAATEVPATEAPTAEPTQTPTEAPSVDFLANFDSINLADNGHILSGVAFNIQGWVVSTNTVSDIAVSFDDGANWSVLSIARANVQPEGWAANPQGYFSGNVTVTAPAGVCNIQLRATDSTTGVTNVFKTINNVTVEGADANGVATLTGNTIVAGATFTSDLTLDLNGYTATGSVKVNGGTLTVKDSSEAKTGLFVTAATGDDGITVNNGSGLVVDGAAINGGYDALFISEGVVTIKDSTITGGVAAVHAKNSSTVTITNSVINGGNRSTNAALKAQNTATITVDADTTINGDCVVNNNTTLSAAFLAAEGCTIAFTNEAAHANSADYTKATATVSVAATEAPTAAPTEEPAADPYISLDKTTFTEGETITVNYGNSVNAGTYPDWIAIYANGVTPVSGGTPSLQYAYVAGTGSVVFNNPTADNHIDSDLDSTWNDTTKVFYNEAGDTLQTLPAGSYNVYLLDDGDYTSVVAPIAITIEAPATEAPATEAPATDAPAPGNDAQNAIVIESADTTVTVPAGTKLYYTYTAFVSQELTVANASDFAVYAVGMRTMESEIPVVNGVANEILEPVMMAITFAIENLTDTEQTYDITLVEYNPIGTMSNPDTLVMGENVANANEGYYYTYTATDAGSLKITMSDEATAWGWFYKLTNESQYTYGDSHVSSDDPVCISDSIACAAGDIITVLIDTEDTSSNPVAFTAEFIPDSTATDDPTGDPSDDPSDDPTTPPTGDEGGTAEDPEPLVIGENIANSTGADFYYYTYTATEAGKLTITMNGTGWVYKTITASEESIDSTSEATKVITLAEGETVQVLVSAYDKALWSMTAGTVSFTAAFEAGASDESPAPTEYVVDTYFNDNNEEVCVQLDVGENEVTLRPDAITTIYEFRPAEAGKYTITATAGALVGYWGGTSAYVWDQTAEKTNVLSIEIEIAGQCAMIGISGIEAGSITIEKTGETDYVENEIVDFEGTYEVLPYEHPADSEVVWIDVMNAEGYELVYNETDCYYHLGTADGPVILVSLNNNPYGISFSEALQNGNIVMDVTEKEDGSLKITHANDVVIEYIAASNGGFYPLTEDLMAILQGVGYNSGWYSEGSFIFGDDFANVNHDIAWMFACAYIEAEDVPATDAPATDAPATDAPATDAPATDAPATDAPATDRPSVPNTSDTSVAIFAIIAMAAAAVVAVTFMKKRASDEA